MVDALIRRDTHLKYLLEYGVLVFTKGVDTLDGMLCLFRGADLDHLLQDRQQAPRKKNSVKRQFLIRVDDVTFSVSWGTNAYNIFQGYWF